MPRSTSAPPRRRRQRHARFAPYLLVICAVSAVALAAVSAAAATDTAACSQRVIADWSADGRVDRTYAPACYERALRSLPEDLRAYSSAADDIGRALLTVRAGKPLRTLAGNSRLSDAAAGGSRGALTIAVPAVAGLLLLGVAGTWLRRLVRRSS